MNMKDYNAQVMLAMKMAIEEETPKLKKNEKLKVKVSVTEEGVEIHAYPIPKDAKSS
tara:strand:+ start:1724 stop:1894 length:171 start_codon:yes stop_codon:yes gene_type:complete